MTIMLNLYMDELKLLCDDKYYRIYAIYMTHIERLCCGVAINKL